MSVQKNNERLGEGGTQTLVGINISQLSQKSKGYFAINFAAFLNKKVGVSPPAHLRLKKPRFVDVGRPAA